MTPGERLCKDVVLFSVVFSVLGGLGTIAKTMITKLLF
jgi:hypothetical protein